LHNPPSPDKAAINTHLHLVQLSTQGRLVGFKQLHLPDSCISSCALALKFEREPLLPSNLGMSRITGGLYRGQGGG
jgi:hypothetical protein